jgi:hypothetical protein
MTEPTLRLELSDRTLVDVRASGPLTLETFNELMDYVRIYQTVLKKRARASSGSHPEVPHG